MHIAARNAEKTIRVAVTSTLRALPRDAEVLVLANGCQDRTAQVAADIADRRLRVVEEPSAIGYVEARRRLLAGSDSDLVAVMDADDICLPWRFVHQMARLSGADAVVSPVVRFSTGPLRVSPGMPLPITAEAMPLHLILGCPLAHPTLLTRRSVLDRVGGYRTTPAEDYDLYLRLVTAGLRLIRTTVPCLGYREHPSQLSRAADFQARLRADPAFHQVFSAFLGTHFAVSPAEVDEVGSGRWPSGDRLAELVETAVAARRLGPVQRKLVGRYRRAVLG